MDRKIFALPVIVALAVLIGTQMFAPALPQAQSPAWDVTTLDLPFAPPAPPVAQPVVTPPVTPAVGPGYRPASNPDCNCVDCKCADCKCGELEKRVAALEAKVAAYGTARPVASHGSSGVSSFAGVPPLPYGATLVSERVTKTYDGVPQAVYRQPAPPQRTPVRDAIQGMANGTCRMVNGAGVCN